MEVEMEEKGKYQASSGPMVCGRHAVRAASSTTVIPERLCNVLA